MCQGGGEPVQPFRFEGMTADLATGEPGRGSPRGSDGRTRAGRTRTRRSVPRRARDAGPASTRPGSGGRLAIASPSGTALSWAGQEASRTGFSRSVVRTMRAMGCAWESSRARRLAISIQQMWHPTSPDSLETMPACSRLARAASMAGNSWDTGGPSRSAWRARPGRPPGRSARRPPGRGDRRRRASPPGAAPGEATHSRSPATRGTATGGSEAGEGAGPGSAGAGDGEVRLEGINGTFRGANSRRLASTPRSPGPSPEFRGQLT